MEFLDFFKHKKVLITGHTGFKGSWLSFILLNAGADIVGYSLDSPTNPSLFELIGLKNDVESILGDVRDYKKLLDTVKRICPEIIIHMAAQPLVRESYINPRETFEINVMGTVNVCEAIRQTDSVRSFLNVTTDKVYLNKEWNKGYVETDPLDGFDPYSNSKSCSELVTHSYINSFFNNSDIATSTARAGNVIGGGDFAKDRIIPDCVRAISKGEKIVVRNPNSIRPYQHVLEPLFAYLMIVKEQEKDKGKSGYYNVGPEDTDCIETGKLVDIFCKEWRDGASWQTISNNGPHEANFLKLDCRKIKEAFGWTPKWSVEKAIYKAVEWYKPYVEGERPSNRFRDIMEKQVKEFIKQRS